LTTGFYLTSPNDADPKAGSLAGPDAMAKQLKMLDVPNRQAWRKWLEQNHASSSGVWLIFYKDRDRAKGLPYEDSVREALCFGWVDSLIKRLDDERYARKFTPRKPTSKWSDINRRRWQELKESALLAPAGIAAAPTDNRYAAKPEIPELPGYVARALKADPEAWRYFQQLAPTYRRQFVVWIHLAKRPETREKRIRESIALLAAGKKLGLK
jgi:uncharacterized protein YdeI (YjbR/CyaY-like superfamily)